MQLTWVIKILLGECINKYVSKNIVLKSQNGPSDPKTPLRRVQRLLTGNNINSSPGPFYEGDFQLSNSSPGHFEEDDFSSPRFFKTRGLPPHCFSKPSCPKYGELATSQLFPVPADYLQAMLNIYTLQLVIHLFAHYMPGNRIRHLIMHRFEASVQDISGDVLTQSVAPLDHLCFCSLASAEPR